MALADKLKEWMDNKDLGPERKKLAERIIKDANDEGVAGNLNKLLDEIEKGEK